MRHEFIQHLPFCRHCGMTFQEHKEFSQVCPGQLVEDAGVTPPPTPLPIGAELPLQPVPRLAFALHQAVELVRQHYEAGSQLSEADGRHAPRNQRAMARSLARMAGADPDAMVIAPGVLPKMPKGAVLIEFHLFKMMPYWCLFLGDAQAMIEAATAANDGKEWPHE